MKDVADAEPRQTTTADCIVCKGYRKHYILATEKRETQFEEAGILTWDDYEIIQCCGCEDISFRQLSGNTVDCDENGEPIYTEKLYPSRAVRVPIAGHVHFPAKVARVYKETLIALSNDAPLLAAIGIRGVVEAICADKKCKGNNLEKKIDSLVDGGSLSADQADFFHLQRFMGILSDLRAQRDRINTAIAALESTVTSTRRGRPAGRRRHMSAAARARISKAMKLRWASGKMKGNRRTA
jgi:hypothetical protein